MLDTSSRKMYRKFVKQLSFAKIKNIFKIEILTVKNSKEFSEILHEKIKKNILLSCMNKK